MATERKEVDMMDDLYDRIVDAKTRLNAVTQTIDIHSGEGVQLSFKQRYAIYLAFEDSIKGFVDLFQESTGHVINFS